MDEDVLQSAGSAGGPETPLPADDSDTSGWPDGYEEDGGRETEEGVESLEARVERPDSRGPSVESPESRAEGPASGVAASPLQAPEPLPFATDLFTPQEWDQLRRWEDSSDPQERLRAQVEVNRRVARAELQGMLAAQSQFGHIPAQALTVYQRDMQYYLAHVDPTRRGTRQAVDEALSFAIHRRAEKNGFGAYSEAAQLLASGQSPVVSGQSSVVGSQSAGSRQQEAGGGRSGESGIRSHDSRLTTHDSGAAQPLPAGQQMTRPHGAGPAEQGRRPRGDHDLRKFAEATGLPLDLVGAAAVDLGFGR